MRKHLFALLIFTIFLFPFQGLWSQQPGFSAEMIAEINTVREVQLSPNGEKIAYTLRIPGGKTDKPGTSWNELWTVDFDGKNARRYVSQPNSAWDVQWSPDGKHLYFLARRDAQAKGTQIFRIPIDGGEAERVSEHEESISSYKLSPDGTTIAFTARDGLSSEEKQDIAMGKDWIVYGEYKHFKRLHTLSVASGQSRPCFEDDLEVGDFTWAPDNQTLVFRAARTTAIDDAYMFQRIYQVRARGGEVRQVAETAGKLGSMAVSPDGKTLAWCGAVDISDPLPQSVFVAPLDGSSSPRNLSKDLKASVGTLTWLTDSELFLNVNEGVYTNLYQQSVKDGKMRPVVTEGPIMYGLSVDASSGRFAMAGNTPQHPNEVLAGDIGSGKVTRRTHSNPDLDQVVMGKQEVITWKGPDGWDIEGILTYPVNYQKGKKYPLLLQIHGGPEGVSTHGWNTRSVYPVQLYAANGFMVLEPNYRGSKGRGVEFAKADHKDLAGKEFEDVLAGIDALEKRGLIDPAKVGTGGFSYGGYFSAWAATKHSDRFKAAMVGAGITNWISFTGTTDIIQENSLVHWNLWWYDHFKLVWDRSPLAHINNAKTPTLVVHGERDLRVPPGQGIEMYNALKLKDVPTELVIYKRQPHGIREYSAQVDYMNRTLTWFSKYVK